MINYDILKELTALSEQSDYSRRITAQLNYACNLTAAHDGKFDDCIEQAVDFLAKSVEENGVITKQAALECEEILSPLKEDAKKYTVHCVAHAHIDMNWMWGYQETVNVTIDTFRTILDLMKEYPDFTFAQSQASTYEIIEKYAPYMLDEIKMRIKEGRFEVSASTWVETDKNMPSGESLARHILYTRRYLSKLLDIPAESMNLDFEPDTFGHNANVPEICAAGGVKYYYHCRGSSHEHDAYLWKGGNGSELIVFRDPHWYSEEIHPNSFLLTPMLCKKDGLSSLLCVYGVGDHGGGPTRRDVERIIEMSSWSIMPTIKFSSYRAFFKELEEIKDTLPVLEGERNFIFDGCYTSQAKIKMANRLAEDRIFESESLSALSSFKSEYNFASSFSSAWKNILFNHFHDILPGSGTVDTREHALGRFQDSMAVIASNSNYAMGVIAKNIDTTKITLEKDIKSTSEGGGTGFGSSHEENFRLPSTERGMGKTRLFHIFNPTEFDFDGVTDITVFDWNFDPSRAIFKSENGETIEHQILEDGKHYWGHGYKKFALKLSVPAFGYTSCILDMTPAGGYGKPGLPYMRNDNYTGDDIVLENKLIRAVFDHMTAELKSLTDKKTGKELISSPSCILNLITENTIHGMTSWRVGDYMNKQNLNHCGAVRVYSISTSGLRRHIKYDFAFGKRSKLNVCIYLDEYSSMLEFNINVDFHETGNGKEGIPQLSFALPFSYESEKCRFDIPFGTIDRSYFDFDVPANSFAIPLSKEGPSLMLISDSKYGFRYTENNLSLSLIRASFDPDPYPEYGNHSIRLGVGVCDTDDSNTDAYMKASGFVHHLPYRTADLINRTGSLPLTNNFIKINGNLKVSALKTAEDCKGLIIRFFTPGKESTKYSFSFASNVEEAYYTDINENIISTAALSGNTVEGEISPCKISTLLIKLK